MVEVTPKMSEYEYIERTVFAAFPVSLFEHLRRQHGESLFAHFRGESYERTEWTPTAQEVLELRACKKERMRRSILAMRERPRPQLP